MMIGSTGARVPDDDPMAQSLGGGWACTGQPVLGNVPSVWLEAVHAIALSAPL